MQRVTITSMCYYMRCLKHYRTFSLSLTWVGYNAMHYHNFNVLPNAIPYNFTQFSMVLRLFAKRYHALPSIFLKKILIYIFLINLTVTRGNALQIAPKPCWTEWKHIRLVTHWSYGNAFHYGLPMLN